MGGKLSAIPTDRKRPENRTPRRPGRDLHPTLKVTADEAMSLGRPGTKLRVGWHGPRRCGKLAADPPEKETE